MFGVNSAYTNYSDTTTFPIDNVTGMYEGEYTALGRYGWTNYTDNIKYYIGIYNQSYNETENKSIQHKYWFARWNFSFRNPNSYMCNMSFIKSLNQSFGNYY